MTDKVMIWIDGGSRGNPGLSAIGVYAIIPGKNKPVEANGFIGKKTNNEAEYSALIYALDLIKKYEWKDVIIHSDSLLIVNQVNGTFQIKNLHLMKLYERVFYYLHGLRRLGKVEIIYVPREQNKEADKLVNIALDEAIKNGVNEEIAFI
jgi:ribonuclease HI